ncbi:MAG: hypothetical protein Q7R95_06040 [bacterium]|nr:hypothetical protein [bacterium]
MSKTKNKDKITIKKHYAEQLEFPKIDLIKLPPKWTVKENCVLDSVISYDFFDENGDLQFTHPKDNNSIRNFCWGAYNRVEK